MLLHKLWTNSTPSLIVKWQQIHALPIGRKVSNELTTALRPFYFAVHPDRFNQHPLQRSVNEESLKRLSAHIESLCEKRYHVLHESKTLQFYIRDIKAESRDTFKLIQIILDKKMRDPKMIVQRLLELCSLPTDFIKQIKSTESYTSTAADPNIPQRDVKEYTYGTQPFEDFDNNFEKEKIRREKTLDSWISVNAELAKKRASELVGLKEDVEKLQKAVVKRLGLSDARYDCGWNYEHYRGCLKTLERLADMHQNHLGVLKNRIVVFAPFTGVSLEGHVMLFTGDVLNNWIDFIKNIPKHDAFLKKIPIYENTLSQVLLNIKIARRKFMPKQQAGEYVNHLMKVTTTLGDYLSTNKFPSSWPNSLEEYEIVIESEAGPLMVNPTGQMIAPATCPGFMLVDFITENMEEAKSRRQKYNEQKYIESELLERCIKELQLKSLTKDDSITLDKMIETMNKLIEFAQPFDGIELHITNYYSVLSDGVMCIPWDFIPR